MKITIVGNANLSQMRGEWGKLEAQVEATNAALAAQAGLMDGLVSAAAGGKMRQALRATDVAFSDALNSSKAYRVETVKMASVTEDFTQKLKAQKLGLMELLRSQKIANRAYEEQLALQNSIVRTAGNGKYQVAIPTAVSKELDTMNKRMAWYRAQVASAAQQTINWGKNTQWAGRQLMVGFTMPIAAFGAATGMMAYQIDKEMTRIKKVYDVAAHDYLSASDQQIEKAKELKQVQQDAMETASEAAREYGVSAKDTLAVQAELAAVGQKGLQLQETTKEVLRIATLGEVDHQTALQTSIALQSVFNMSTRELAESFNYMNSIENATSLATRDFAAAIPIAAAPVKAFGGDIQELGLLLTAMREQGINAGEGANAIKASLQRLSRPSKQVRAEFEALTGQSITELVEGSNSLVEIFQKISDATEDLALKDQRKVFAGLFGSYQVTRMMAMTKGMENLEKGIGQVSEAYRIGQQDASEWAEVAEGEIKEWQESASGRIKRLIEEIKTELADFGGRFLNFASKVLEGFSAIIKMFNSLPDGVKNLTAMSAVFVALVGPIVMLVGLFGNLAGNLTRAMNAVAGLRGKFNIMNVESRVTQATTSSLGTTIQTTGKQAEIAAGQLRLFAAAQNESAQAGLAAASGVRATRISSGTAVPGAGTLVGSVKRGSSPVAEAERSSARMKSNIAGGAMYSAALAASMGTVAFSSNETARNVASIALTMMTIGPLLGGVGKGLKALGSSTGPLAKFGRLFGAGGGVVGGLKLATRFIGPAGLLVGGSIAYYQWHKKAEDSQKRQIQHMKNIAREQTKFANSSQSFASIMGVEARQYETLAHNLNLRENGDPMKDLVNKFRTDGRELITQFTAGRDNQWLAGTGIGAFGKSFELEADQILQLAQKYQEGVRLMGLSAQESADMIQAFLEAVGMSTSAARAQANELKNLYGSEITATEMGNLWRQQFYAALEGNEYGVRDAVNNIMQQFRDAMENSPATTRGKLWSQLNTMVYGGKDEYNRTVDGLAQDLDLIPEAVRQAVEKSDYELSQLKEVFNEITAITGSGGGLWVGSRQRSQVNDLLGLDLSSDEIVNLVRAMESMGNANIEKAQRAAEVNDEILKQVADQIGYEGKIVSLKQLQNTWHGKFYQAMTATKKQANDLLSVYFKEVDARVANNEITKETADAWKLMFVNQQRVARGLPVATSWSERLEKSAEDVTTETGRAAAQAERLAAAWRSAKQNTDWAGIVRSARTEMQQIGADMAMAKFESNMSAATESYANAQNARVEALQNSFERANNAFEKRWERRKKSVEAYFDKRIEGVERAMEAEEKAEKRRQQIFEAEKSRISRLQEMQNMQIDFNAALRSGDLDEAAKISNNIDATEAEWELADAEKAMEKRHERRMKSLEKKQERFENQKDRRLEQLKEIEDAEKKALAASQKRREAALKAEVDANISANQKMWDDRKSTMDEAIRYFMSYIATNEQDLAKHVKRTERKYGEFGKVVTQMGKDWHHTMQDGYTDAIRLAANEVKTSIEWEAIGQTISDKTIYGALGMNRKQWVEWMKGGDFKQAKKKPASSPGRDFKTGDVPVRHEGGLVDDSKGSRRGVARQLSGLHPSEKMVLAQKGEFIVNRRDAAKHADILHDINSGKSRDEIMGGEGFPSFLGRGLIPDLSATIMASALNKSITEKSDEKRKADLAREVMMNAALTAGIGYQGRKYNVGPVKPWVQEAADYLGSKFGISNIGGYRKSAVDKGGHPAGLALDFMTYANTALGDKMADYIIANRGKLDAEYMIWKQRIIGGSGGWGSWRGMENRGSPTANHMDHIHLNFNPTGKTGDLIPPTSGFVQGRGGSHHPTGRVGSTGTRIHGSPPAIDIALPEGNRIFAVKDGIVTDSYDLPGYEPRSRHGGLGYRSYGRVIKIRHDDGAQTLYAHLSQRFAKAGQRVKGGSVIGKSGNTGYSTGPHLHFGATDGPMVHLKKGAQNIKWDNTIANLHKGEAVLTEDINKKFQQGVENFAEGGHVVYHLDMEFHGITDTERMVVEVMNGIKTIEKRKPHRRGN